VYLSPLDFTHCLSDSVEGVTHSLCTLEFENNRALYDWVLDTLEVYHPQQIEFARLNLSYTLTSKRRLLQLVNDGVVSGWDDPRMPTLSGLRRRGCTPEAIRAFMEAVGMSKANSRGGPGAVRLFHPPGPERAGATAHGGAAAAQAGDRQLSRGPVEWMEA
jgi:glutamyl/glutaminyl-tRNA synthetase